MVKKGDTIAAIAKRYKVSADDVKKWNKLGAASLATGQKLVIEQIVTDTPGKRRIASKGGKKGKATVKPKRALKVARG